MKIMKTIRTMTGMISSAIGVNSGECWEGDSHYIKSFELSSVSGRKHFEVTLLIPGIVISKEHSVIHADTELTLPNKHQSYFCLKIFGFGLNGYRTK